MLIFVLHFSEDGAEGKDEKKEKNKSCEEKKSDESNQESQCSEQQSTPFSNPAKSKSNCRWVLN